MIHLDTFSGIGGFALAAHWAGFETAAFCEIEPFAQAVLRKHWPETPIYDDIKTLTAGTLRRAGIGHIDLLTGGFPCQDISAAGRGEGITGNRSILWFELERIINECLPGWVVIENSPLLRLRGADIVLEGLEKAGYTAWPLVVGADDAGAPHIRKRAFIVAHANSRRIPPGAERTGRPKRADINRSGSGTAMEQWPLADTDMPEWRESDSEHCNLQCARNLRIHAGRPESASGSESCREALADTDQAGRGEQWGTVAIRTAFTAAECGSECPAQVGNPAGCGVRCGMSSGERGQLACANQANPAAGSAKPGLGGNANGIPGRLDMPGWPSRPGETQRPEEPPRTGLKIPNRAARLKGLGNAVVPQVVYPILQEIADFENGL